MVASGCDFLGQYGRCFCDRGLLMDPIYTMVVCIIAIFFVLLAFDIGP